VFRVISTGEPHLRVPKSRIGSVRESCKEGELKLRATTCNRDLKLKARSESYDDDDEKADDELQ
jgi:hypothetical protein